MKQLAAKLPGSVCVKNHDVSTTGLPDFSVTYRGFEFKIEFKLWVPLKSWDETPRTVPILAIAEEQPQQLAMMRRYAGAASLSIYIVWVKKSKCVVLWDPRDAAGCVVSTKSTADMVELVSLRITRIVN